MFFRINFYNFDILFKDFLFNFPKLWLKTVQAKLQMQKKLSERPETKQRDEEAFRAKLEARKRSAEPESAEATNFKPRATFEPVQKPKSKSSGKSRTSEKRLSIDDSVGKSIDRPDRRDPSTKVKFDDRKVVTIGQPDVPRASNRHPEKPKDIQVRRDAHREKEPQKAPAAVKKAAPEPPKPEPPKPSGPLKPVILAANFKREI